LDRYGGNGRDIFQNSQECYNENLELGRSRIFVDTTGLSFELANIVVLYRGLRNAKVFRDVLLNLYPDENPTHIDVGPLLAVRYLAHRVEIYVFSDENRVETKILTPAEADWLELPKRASQVYEAIQGAELAVFGFNYFAAIPAPGNEDVNEFLVRTFQSSLDPLAAQLDGDIISFASTIKYTKNQKRHQLQIEAKPENLLSLRLNVEYPGGEFPSEEALTQLYLAHRDDFISTIGRLFTNA
jgi:hypothetical protein